MGGEISMEDEEFEVFDEKEFAKQWNKHGLGNESMWNFFGRSYEQIVQTILRPMAEGGKPGRMLYDPDVHLGPREVEVWPGNPSTAIARRTDHTMTNYSNRKIVFSLWQLTSSVSEKNSRSGVVKPCVIYLHSAVGARPEALQALHASLRAGAHFCAVDFQGSGLSEGDIVTWGYFENNDVVDVVRFILKLGIASKFALWGRQLGAATALMYAARDPRVCAVIVDTPFSSLDDQMNLVVKQAQKEGMSVPRIVFKAALAMLKRSVRKRIAKKFDPSKLAPKKHAPKCKCRGLFITDTDDGVIPTSMVKLVFDKYPKKLRSWAATMGSGHFGPRKGAILQTCTSFLTTSFRGGSGGPSSFLGSAAQSREGKDAMEASWPPKWILTLNQEVQEQRLQRHADAKTFREQARNGEGEMSEALQGVQNELGVANVDQALAEFESHARSTEAEGSDGERKAR